MGVWLRVLLLVLGASPAFGAFDRCERAVAMMADQDPILFFRQKHWTIADTRKIFGNGEGIPRDVVDALVKGYDGIYERAAEDARRAGTKAAKLDTGRFAVDGLKSVPSKPDEPYRVRDLPPDVVQKIDAWAQEILRMAQQATDEELEIRSISLGRGWSAGGETPRVHVDNQGTYIHAVTTLKGPSTLLFPSDARTTDHYIVSEDPKTGQLTLRPPRNADSETPIPSDDATAARNGETAIITGTDYLSGPTRGPRIPGRVGTVHSSPLKSDLDRITLFIDIQPKKKK
jgi:hypothetical protein